MTPSGAEVEVDRNPEVEVAWVWEGSGGGY